MKRNYVEFIREQVLLANGSDPSKKLARSDMKAVLSRFGIDFECIEHQFIGDHSQSRLMWCKTAKACRAYTE
jgi:hypothetical protein